jgi:sugar phosphate isomerase/epimerase
MTEYSYQLYSSRNFPPLTETLKMVAGLGYAQVEGYGSLYADASSLGVLEKGLKDTGLAMPTGHFALDMVRDEPARVKEIARTLGLKGIFVPYIMPDDRPKSAKGWAEYGSSLGTIGAQYKDAGLFFGYHNHDFEYVPTDGGHRPLDLILEGGPDLVLEFDVAWSVRGGVDAMETIRKHGPRIRAAHVKDIAPAGQNADQDGWCDVGDGTVPWPSLLAALKAAGTTYFVMEHDNPKDHRQFASRSIAAVKRM